MLEPRSNLQQLGLSDSEITVYLAMTAGARTAYDLQKTTDLKRPTIYYAIGCLEKRGLISKTGLEGGKRFAVEPLSRLEALAKERVQEASALVSSIQDIIPLLEVDSPADSKPIVSFFEGTDAVKRVVMDMLYCKKKHIDSIAPEQNFFREVGQDFVKAFVSERMKRNIRTRNLWDAPIDAKVLKEYYAALSEVRIVPKMMQGKFRSSIFLFDDKTLYVSSKQSSYCLLITSKEHHDTMSALFEGLWSASKPHP